MQRVVDTDEEAEALAPPCTAGQPFTVPNSGIAIAFCLRRLLGRALICFIRETEMDEHRNKANFVKLLSTDFDVILDFHGPTMHRTTVRPLVSPPTASTPAKDKPTDADDDDDDDDDDGGKPAAVQDPGLSQESQESQEFDEPDDEPDEVEIPPLLGNHRSLLARLTMECGLRVFSPLCQQQLWDDKVQRKTLLTNVRGVADLVAQLPINLRFAGQEPKIWSEGQVEWLDLRQKFRSPLQRDFRFTSPSSQTSGHTGGKLKADLTRVTGLAIKPRNARDGIDVVLIEENHEGLLQVTNVLGVSVPSPLEWERKWQFPGPREFVVEAFNQCLRQNECHLCMICQIGKEVGAVPNLCKLSLARTTWTRHPAPNPGTQSDGARGFHGTKLPGEGIPCPP